MDRQDLGGRWDVTELYDADHRAVVLPVRRVWLELDPAERSLRADTGNELSGSYRHRGDRWRVRRRDVATTLALVRDEPPLRDRLLDVRHVEADGDDVVMTDARRRPVVRLRRP